MIRQTGGRVLALTSTRSMSTSRAMSTSLVGVHDADVVALVVDQTDLADGDAVIDRGPVSRGMDAIKAMAANGVNPPRVGGYSRRVPGSGSREIRSVLPWDAGRDHAHGPGSRSRARVTNSSTVQGPEAIARSRVRTSTCPDSASRGPHHEHVVHTLEGGVADLRAPILSPRTSASARTPAAFSWPEDLEGVVDSACR